MKLGLGTRKRKRKRREDLLLSETKAYNARVKADGGYIQDIDIVNAEIKAAKDANEYSTLLRFYPEQCGIKIDRRLGVDYVTKIYDVKGASGDIIISTELNQPVLQEDGTYYLFSQILLIPAIAGTAITHNITFEIMYKPDLAHNQAFGAVPSQSGTDVRMYIIFENTNILDRLGYMENRDDSGILDELTATFTKITLLSSYSDSKMYVYLNDVNVKEYAGTTKNDTMGFVLGDGITEAFGYLKSAKIRQWN